MSQPSVLCVLALDGSARLRSEADNVLAYAAACAEEVQLFCIGGQLAAAEAEKLSQKGVHVLLECQKAPLSDSAAAYALATYLKTHTVRWVLGAQTLRSQLFFAELAAHIQVPLVPHVVGLPQLKENHLHIRRSVYSGKAFEELTLSPEAHYIMLLHSHIVPPYAGKATALKRMKLAAEALPKTFPGEAVQVKAQHIVAHKKVPLHEARIVVSGGRGMKGAEHWHLIEALAEALGAATACSKPVSDMEWRPHHEHVGQTGLKINPELYIAVGISGAVQHLAGVHTSKVIVVINTDPEAPFFQAADYGIQGDAFEVLPKLTQSLVELNKS